MVIKITLPAGEAMFDGKITSFIAPCACNDITGIDIREYGTTSYKSFSLVDAANIPASRIVNGFVNGATVSVILSGSNAVIMNPSYQKQIDELNANKAPMYTYGTTDLTAGVSPLETGKLYLVYE